VVHEFDVVAQRGTGPHNLENNVLDDVIGVLRYFVFFDAVMEHTALVLGPSFQVGLQEGLNHDFSVEVVSQNNQVVLRVINFKVEHGAGISY
jgi:hypothetical protein